MEKSKMKVFVALHLMLMTYSTSGICSKLAANEVFFSPMFCVYYGCVIILLGAYAIGWQQIIKRIPLTTAFANKSVTIVWGMIWGRLVFHEKITIGKIIGVILVVTGVVLFAKSDEVTNNEL